MAGSTPEMEVGPSPWETSGHVTRPLTDAGTTAPIDMATTPWIAALALCLRRYGAPTISRLTVFARDTAGRPTARGTIELSFADTVGTSEWLEEIHRQLINGSGASDAIVPDEASTANGWRVALVLHTDLPTLTEEPWASCDRVFAINPVSDSIRLTAARRRVKADVWPVAQMLPHWAQLAQGFVDTPMNPIGRLPIDDPASDKPPTETEKKPGTANANLRFIFELFDDQAARTPHAPAVTDRGRTVTFHELWERSNKLAHYLQQLGVGPESIVGVFLGRSIELVEAVVGLQKAGAGYLPIDPAYPPGRLEYLIADSRVSLIITDALLVEKLPPGNYRAVLIDREADAIALMDGGIPSHGLRPGNMAFVFYTSGSTGQPKGVVMEHAMRPPFDRTKQEADNLAEGEKVLLKSPVGFTLILREIFWPLQWGGHLVVLPDGLDRDSAHLVRVMRDERVVGANFVPSMLSLLVDEPGFEQCTSLRLIYTVGESLAVEVQQRLLARIPGIRLFVFYGCTEAPAATFRECLADEPYGNRIVIGKPMANKKVYLLDRNLMPVPPGVVGEIHTGGQISRGYLHRPGLTADRFIPDPFSERPGARFYRTGDLARQLLDGSLEFLGRTDFQVQVGGIRIELGEIEAVIASHPSVKEVLVIADPRHLEQTRLIAYYTDRDERRTLVAELRSSLRSQVPEYMMPASFTRLAAFPLNTNGKIDRRSLPEPKPETTLPDGLIIAPRTAAEVRLLGIWARVLGTDRLGVTDRFFDLGGDSILAAKVLVQINREFGSTLSLPDFHREPTIEAVARLVLGESVGTGLRLFLPISTQGNRRPVFMANTYPALARYIGPDQPFYGMKNHWLDARFDFQEDVPAIARAFMHEMREIQPDGPYAVFGFSMGGLFALELARQLEEAGQELDVLLLLDPTMPDDADEPQAPQPPGDVASTGGARGHWSHLQNLSWSEKFTYVWKRRGGLLRPLDKVRRKLRLRLGLALNAMGRDLPFSMRKGVATHYYSHIRRSYKPQPLRTRAKVFLVDRHVPARMALLNRIFPAGVDVRVLPTSEHLDTMDEPYLSQWMAELKAGLNGAPSGRPESSVSAQAASSDHAAAVESDDQRRFQVAENNEGQFSVWPTDWELPGGWKATGFTGDRPTCLTEVGRIWTDHRPASLR